MKTIFIALFLLTLVFAQTDPCRDIPTCIQCVAKKFCGWCSSPVIFIDGTKGKQCAYQGNGAKPFVCDGTYQTETCIPEEYKCDNSSYQCRPVPAGSGGVPIEKCLADCFPAVYYCDKKSNRCIKSTPGNGTDFKTCNDSCNNEQKYSCDQKTQKCVKSESGTSFDACNKSCGQAENVTNDIIGKWRGLQISIGYKVGEWKMDVTNTSLVTITTPDKTIWAQGILQKTSNELWIVEKSGTRRSIFMLTALPTVQALTWAVGAKNLPPPPDFDTAMQSNNPGTVFVMYKCQSESNCDFSHLSDFITSTINSLLKRANIKDNCEVHPDCKSCIGDKLNKCGWCSTNVIYNNTVGKQCAGHNEDGSKDPFICNGVYSTETCDFPTSTSSSSTSSTGKPTSTGKLTSGTTGGPKKYECVPANATCELSENGQYPFKQDCEAVCQKQPFVPIDLLGTWRGLQINKGYIIGEWRAVFTQTNVTVTRPNKDKFSAAVTLVANYLIMDIQTGDLKGKKIQTLWNIAFGVETKFFTWAWGVPNGKPPQDFQNAMTAQNNAEFIFASCLTNKNPKICNFDH